MNVTLDAQALKGVAVVAICDAKTVARYLRRERVRSTSEIRIRRALRTLGLADWKREPVR